MPQGIDGKLQQVFDRLAEMSGRIVLNAGLGGGDLEELQHLVGRLQAAGILEPSADLTGCPDPRQVPQRLAYLDSEEG